MPRSSSAPPRAPHQAKVAQYGQSLKRALARSTPPREPSSSSSSSPLETRLPLRPTYDGDAFEFKHSKAGASKLTDAARCQAVEDVHWLKAQPERVVAEFAGRTTIEAADRRTSLRTQVRHELERSETRGRKPTVEAIVARHYGVDKKTVKNLVRTLVSRPNLAALQRPGRPAVLTPTKQARLKEVFNKHEGRAPLRKLASESVEGWETSYDKEKRKSPSTYTWRRYLKDATIRTLRPRPDINNSAKAVSERLSYCTAYLQCAADSIDVDEAYVRPGSDRKKPSVIVEPGEKPPPYVDAAHGYPPNVLLIGLVTAPEFEETVDATGQSIVKVSKVQDGKVLLARVRGVRQRQKARRGLDGKLIEKSTDPIYFNLNINGAVYRELMRKEGGGLDMVDEYIKADQPGRQTAKVLAVDMTVAEASEDEGELVHKGRRSKRMRSGQVRIQEDGAPGHGFDNRHEGRPTDDVHDQLVGDCEKRDFKLVKQPRLSPETNMLDLGVWNMLKSAVGPAQPKSRSTTARTPTPWSPSCGRSPRRSGRASLPRSCSTLRWSRR